MRRSRTLILTVAAALAAGGSAVYVASSASAATTPTAAFAKVSDWGSGWQGQYTITNGGTSALTSWTVEFDLPSGTSVGSYWDALLTSSGQHFSFTNRNYNASVAPGASVSFGFLGSGTGSPTGCLLNGAACAGGATPTTPPPTTTPAPTPTSTTPPPTTPPPTTPPPTTRPPTTPPTTRPPTTNPGAKHAWPYLDITASTPSLVQAANATGHRFYTLAFIIGSAAGCEPTWGGTLPLTESRIVNDIAALKAQGGDVIVAFGGAAGPYLEHLCGTQAALAAAYLKVIDTLKINHLDIDIEATVNLDIMNKALAQVQRERPGTTVSFTLMVQGDDYGLTPALGVDVLKNAKANGVNVGIVNPMTMEFGSSRADWGDAVIAASNATLAQMAEIWPEKTDAERRAMLGVTPMIGRNFNGKIFQVEDGQQLVSWANQNQIGSLAFWSVGRDNGGCPGGGISPSCSSISQSQYQFTNIFKGFTG
jgi:chitinase